MGRSDGAVPKQIEAELWYSLPPAEGSGKGWKYFRRCSAGTAADAREHVEAAFKAWGDG